MSSNLRKEILIAGGGIGGLSAALAFSLKGRRVRVLERAAEFGEIGYGIQMGPNVHRMLDILGIAKALEPHAVFPEALIMLDAISGEEVTRISLGAAFLARYKYPYFVIHRRDLHGAMFEACKQRGEIVLEASKGVASFTQTNGGVRVVCDDGSEYEGAALIGADGLWSTVRAQVIGDGAPRLTGHVVYRGVVPTEQIVDRDHLDSVIVYGGRDMHLVQYRLRGGAVMNNVATIVSGRFKHGERDLREFGQPDELLEIFSHAAPKVQDLLAYVGKDRNWILYDREPVSNWTHGNVTLLGDAAHPTLQYLAQGACMAIEDAVVLASKVSQEGSGATNFNKAFLAYQAERFLRTARVQLSARFFGEVLHVDGGAREARNQLLAQRGPENFLEVDWLYKGIPLD